MTRKQSYNRVVNSVTRRTNVLAALLLVTLAGSAFGEGACPPGQYPIGGQGVQGCAPIPQSGAGGGSGPRPTGRWIKTWGAIGLSP